MTFTNQTCPSLTAGDVDHNHSPTLRKPIEIGRRLWEEWILEDIRGGGGGSYLATIRSRANKETIKCSAGVLEPGSFEACEAKMLRAHQVTLREYSDATKKSLWRIVPVARIAGVYNIILNSRPNGCLRYLGAFPSCSNDEVSLFGADDGSGLQQWTITPAFTPANVVPSPSPPATKARPPPPAKEFLVPVVNFTLALPGADPAAIIEEDKATICKNFIEATNYPKDLLYCKIDKVVAASTLPNGSLRKRRLHSYIPAATDSGAVILGKMIFNVVVDSTSQCNVAFGAATTFQTTVLQNPTELNQLIGPQVTGSPVILIKDSSGLTDPTLKPAPPSPSVPSPSPSPSAPPVNSPVNSPAPIVPSPSPIVSPSPVTLSPGNNPIRVISYFLEGPHLQSRHETSLSIYSISPPSLEGIQTTCVCFIELNLGAYRREGGESKAVSGGEGSFDH
jgi:hypothetical protein